MQQSDWFLVISSYLCSHKTSHFGHRNMSQSIVIIPTYNEIENIDNVLQQVFSLPIPFHVLIVDDGSPDGTATRVKTLQHDTYGQRLHLIERSGKLGLGTAYITGFKYALAQGFEYIFEMDADLSHNPQDLLKLHQALSSGSDMVIGSRYVNGLVNVINWPIERLLISYFASHYVKFITGMPVQDSTAGFVGYRREVLQTIILDDIRFIGYGFQIEMKFNAWKYGFKLQEVPIIFTDRAVGVSKMSKNIIFEAVFGIIKLKIYSLFVNYDRKGRLTQSA